MSRSFRRLLARNRRNPLVRSFARHIRSWYRGNENFDYDPIYDGEGYLLSALSGAIGSDAIIFDVGANVGDWAKLAKDRCADAEIHAFELVPDTADALAIRLGSVPGVRINRFGLSDTRGEVPVKISDKDDTRSTLILNAEIEAARSGVISCEVRTGDDYLSENDISRVDLVKVDAEGADHLVIQGFSDALTAERIASIQFEYGRASIAARFLLTDYYDLLTSFGFEIGKLYPGYVDFRPYTPEMEDFLGPNYVAVHRSQSELRRRLMPK